MPLKEKIKYSVEHNLYDAYKYYRKTNKPVYFNSKFSKSNKHLVLSKKTYMSLNKDALSMLKDKILAGNIVNLGARLGNISVIKKKQNIESLIKKNKSSLDWVNTKKFKRPIVNFNDHTNGYVYSFLWNKSNANSKNISLYRFVACRHLKRELAHYIKVLKKDYREPLQ